MRPTIISAPRAKAFLLLFCFCTLGLAPGCNEGGGMSLSFSRVFGDGLFDDDEAVVEHREGETMLRMVGVTFQADTAVLASGSLPVLDKFAEVFDAMPGARIAIEGHTDSRGNESFNLQLSRDRARAVRDYLVEMVGAPPVVFTTEGFGEALPIANNATALGRSQNRRIEIFVEDDPGDPVFEVSLSVDRLSVAYDCDDFTSSPEAAAGDFYMQVEFHTDDDRGRVLADRSPNTLQRLNGGEAADLDIAAEERFIAWDGAVLAGYVDWYENDTGGVHDFDRSEEILRRYNASEKCWEDPRIIVVVGSDGEPDPRARCVAPANGEIASGMLSVSQAGVCVADLEWSLSVEKVAR